MTIRKVRQINMPASGKIHQYEPNRNSPHIGHHFLRAATGKTLWPHSNV